MKKQITIPPTKVMFWRYLSLSSLALTQVVLVGLEIEPLGWIFFIVSLVILHYSDQQFKKYIILAHISVALLGLAPIGTSTEFPFAVLMGLGLLGAVAIPFLVTKYIYKTEVIRFPSLKEKVWGTKRLLYLLLTLFLAWLAIPLMLRSQYSFLNWHLEPGFWQLSEAYLGLNAVGIWDELFFVLTLLAIFQKFIPFLYANIFQAIFFTSFLYAVGFEGWSFVVIYFFALLQGYVFKSTKSLLFILAIHLTIDLVLHLALVYLHYPDKFPYFIT